MTTSTHTTVTQKQMNACERIIDGNTHEAFYIVASSKNDGTEYKVSALKVEGKYFLTCTCAAGISGTPCWHKRAAVACEAEFKAAEKAAKVLTITDMMHHCNGTDSYIVKQADGTLFFVMQHRNGAISCDCDAETCAHIEVVKSHLNTLYEELAQYSKEVTLA